MKSVLVLILANVIAACSTANEIPTNPIHGVWRVTHQWSKENGWRPREHSPRKWFRPDGGYISDGGFGLVGGKYHLSQTPFGNRMSIQTDIPGNIEAIYKFEGDELIIKSELFMMGEKVSYPIDFTPPADGEDLIKLKRGEW